jgi:aldoxime dehydratase
VAQRSARVRRRGFFLESVRPSTARFETLFSNDRLEGVAHLAGTLSGEVAEHAYWGGARDRNSRGDIP